MKKLIFIIVMLAFCKPVLGEGGWGRFWKGDDPWIGREGSRIIDTPTGIEISSHASKTTVKGLLKTDRFHATGSLVGNIPAGDYTETEADGTLEFHGEATVWDDLFMPFSFARVPATNNPAWTSFVGNLNEFTFADGDLLEGTTEIMHDYKEGSSVEPHIHWATQSSDATVRGVKWELEYSIANINYPLFVGDVFPTPTVIATETTVRANLPAKTHIHTSWGDVAMTGIEIGAHIAYRVRRITATGTAPASDPYGLGLGIHYEISTVGSRTPFNK